MENNRSTIIQNKISVILNDILRSSNASSTSIAKRIDALKIIDLHDVIALCDLYSELIENHYPPTKELPLLTQCVEMIADKTEEYGLKTIISDYKKQIC